MNDDNGAVILILILMLFIPVMYVFGIESGKNMGKNEGIVFCMEKQKECKTTYEYLKLQENQK